MQMEQLLILQSHKLNADATGDQVSWVVPQKCEVIRAVVGINDDSTGGAVIKFDKQADGGSRGDGDIAAITIPGADHLGDAFYDEVAKGTVLEAGNVVTVEIATVDATGELEFSAYLICRYMPEEAANQDDLIETA